MEVGEKGGYMPVDWVFKITCLSSFRDATGRPCDVISSGERSTIHGIRPPAGALHSTAAHVHLRSVGAGPLSLLLSLALCPCHLA